MLHGEYPVAGASPRPWTSLLDALRASLAAPASLAAHRDATVLLDNHRMSSTLAAFCREPEGLYPASCAPCDLGTCMCRHSDMSRGEAARRTSGAERGGRLELSGTLTAAEPWVSKSLDPEAKLVTLRVPNGVAEASLAAQLLFAAWRSWKPHLGQAGGRARTPEEAFAATVLVVTPHNRQRGELQLELHRLETAGVAVCAPLTAALVPRFATVEKQQGQEADLVLVMYGLDDAVTIAGEAAFLYSTARLNVALTRARKKAILLLTRAVEESQLESSAATPAIAEGLAFLARTVRVCRAGSAARRTVTDADEPVRGALYVKVVERGGLPETQQSELEDSLRLVELDHGDVGGARDVAMEPAQPQPFTLPDVGTAAVHLHVAPDGERDPAGTRDGHQPPAKRAALARGATGAVEPLPEEWFDNDGFLLPPSQGVKATTTTRHR